MRTSPDSVSASPNPHPATPGLLSARTSAHRECRRCLFSHISTLLFVVSTRSKPTLACPSPCSRPLVAALPSLFSSPSFLGDNQTAATATASSASVLLSFLLHLTLPLVLVHMLYSPSFIILTCFSNARSCWQTASPGRLSFTHPPTQSPDGPVLSHL